MKKLLATFILSGVLMVATNAQDLPVTTLIDLKNNDFNTKQLNKKKDTVIVLCFWASWCIPCINELSIINEQFDNWKKELKFELYAIATDDSRTDKRVKPLVNGKGWEFDVLLDKNQDFKRELNVSNIPYTIVLKNGKIIYRHAGYVSGDESVLKKFISENQ